MWFKQDGAPALYDIHIRNRLAHVIPKRCIGGSGTGRGFIEYPARAPDLNSLDFFILGYLNTATGLRIPDRVVKVPVSMSSISTPHQATSLTYFHPESETQHAFGLGEPLAEATR